MNNEPSIQHKPVVIGHEYGFDDQGERVRVYWRDDDPLNLILLRTLQEQGVTFPNEVSALAVIERFFDQVALECRLHELKWIIDKVGRHSAAGEALDKLFRESMDSSSRNQSPKEKVAGWLDRFKRRVNTKRAT
jgi:hypothetical protein